MATVGGPYFVYPLFCNILLILYKIRSTGPLFCNVPLILYDFRALKLQNKGPPTVIRLARFRKNFKFHLQNLLEYGILNTNITLKLSTTQNRLNVSYSLINIGDPIF